VRNVDEAASKAWIKDPNSDFGTGPESPTAFPLLLVAPDDNDRESWVSPATGQAFQPSSRNSAANSAAKPCSVRISTGETFFTISFNSA